MNSDPLIKAPSSSDDQARMFDDSNLLALFPSEESSVCAVEPASASARADKDSTGAKPRTDLATSREDLLALFPSERSSLAVCAPAPVSVAHPHETARPDARAIARPRQCGPSVSRRSSQRGGLVTVVLLCALSGISVAEHRPQVVPPQVAPPLTSRGTGQWMTLATPVEATTTALSEAVALSAPVERAPAPESRPPVPAAAHNDRQTIVAIQRVLYRYRDAFSILDASAVRAVFPAADERKLRQRFRAIYDQNMEFEACRIFVTGPGATAWCRGSLQVSMQGHQPRLRLERREWRFTLRRSVDDRWSIATVAPE